MTALSCDCMLWFKRNAWQFRLCFRLCFRDLESDQSHYFPPAMPRSKVIYLLRHGEAKHNLYDTGPGSYERRRDPALMDPPLTEKGVAQVEAAKRSRKTRDRRRTLSNHVQSLHFVPIHILDYFRAILLHTSNLNNILQF